MPSPEPFEIALQQWLRDELQMGEVFLSAVPEGIDAATPRLVITPIVGEYDMLLSGASGLIWQEIQFDAYSSVRIDCLVLQEQVRMALQDFKGQIGSYEVLNALPREVPQNPRQKGTENWAKRVEYRICYRTDIPAR